MKTCKNCGESIFYDKDSGYWRHTFTMLFMCSNDSTMAEPK